MMIEGAHLQTPFMSDLVTMADPTSPLSYLSYAKQTNRLYPFYIRENFFLQRKEYNQYCQWVCQQLPYVKFGYQVTKVYFSSADACYHVHAFDKKQQKHEFYKCKHLVLGTGTQPKVPSFCSLSSPRVMHSSDYLRFKDQLQEHRDITLVGSGQSAAEIFYDLLTDIGAKDYKLRWLTRSSRFFPLEYTKLTLEMTSSDYIDYFFHLPEEKRQQRIKQQDQLYKGINSDLINAIYDKLYEKKLDGDLPIQMMTQVLLKNVQEYSQQLSLTCTQQEMEEDFEVDTDFLILATGYDYQFPEFLEPLKTSLCFHEQGSLKLNRNYSIDVNDTVFVQNLGLQTHGLTAPDLGMVCYRNSTILKSILGYAPYKIEEHMIFQQFSP